jgi:hypothetical protein
MEKFTIVVAIDEEHARQFELSWPTWRAHRPQMANWPLLLLCDGVRPAAYWQERLKFADHPKRLLVAWNQPGVSQREKMLTGLTLGALPHITTPWFVKLDTDVIAFPNDAWPRERWLTANERGELPAFIASPWGYTKPGAWLARLDDWAQTVPELKRRPPLPVKAAVEAEIVAHPRVISWCFIGNTAWCRRFASYCGDRLPVPSHDTYLWYCAERQRVFYRKIRMGRHGWKHLSCSQKLRKAAFESLARRAPGPRERPSLLPP